MAEGNDWLDAGMAALALADRTIDKLIEKGVLTVEDRLRIFRAASATLSNPDMDGARALLKKVFPAL